MYCNAMKHVTLRNYKPDARVIVRSTADLFIKLEIISVIYILSRGHWDCTTLKHFCIIWGWSQVLYLSFCTSQRRPFVLSRYWDGRVLSVIYVSSLGHWTCFKLSHFSTVVLTGDAISMPKGVHVDNDCIPSLNIITES
jgi:hypothetical protein